MLSSSLLFLLFAITPSQRSPQPGEPAVTVQVLDANGKPLAGAKVYVEAEPRHGWDGKSYEFVPTAHDSRTDDEGRFRIDPSVGVEYWIGIEPTDEPMAIFELDRDSFRLPGGPVCRLRALRTLRGQLLDPGGEPVADRKVHLIPDELPQSFLAPVLPSGSILMECEDVGYAVAMRGATGHPFERAILTSISDEDGRWSFRARGGEVAVAAEDDHGVVQAAHRVLDQPEETLSLVFEQLEPGTVRVVDHESEPVAGALVYVARGAGWGDHSVLCPVGATDAGGLAQYTSLGGDVSGVAVRHPLQLRWQVDDFHGERFGPGEPIQLVPPESIAAVRLPVRDLQGGRVESLRIRVLMSESELPGSLLPLKQDRLIEAESRELEPGLHEIVADRTALILVDSPRHAPCAVLPIDADQDGEDPIAVLHEGRTYSFRVLDGGKPVRGAAIMPETRWEQSADEEDAMQEHESCAIAMMVLWSDLLTDSDGRWTSPVACKNVRMDFIVQHWDGRTEFVMLPEEEAAVEVEFRVPKVRLTGRIVQNGVPLAGCELVVNEEWTNSADISQRVQIGAEGELAAEVHPGVPLSLWVDDQPEFRTSWRRVLELPEAAELGTFEVNDEFPEFAGPPCPVVVRIPMTPDGFRPSVHLEVNPSDEGNLENFGESLYWQLFANDRGESGVQLPAGTLKITLEWPGRSFRSPWDAEMGTNSMSAAARRLRLVAGETLDLTAVVEELIVELAKMTRD